MNDSARAAPIPGSDRAWQLSGFGAAELADNARAAGSGAATGVLVLAGFVVLALWLTVGLSLRRDDSHETRQAEAGVDNLALAFAEHSAKTLAQADQLARQVRADYRRLGSRVDLSSPLKGQAADAVAHVTVVNADGQSVASSRQPLARQDHHTRDYFTDCQRGGSTGSDAPFVSTTQVDDPSGQWLMQLALPIDDGDGRCAGVVLVAMSPAFVARFLGQAELGQHGVVALVGNDGQVVARAAAGTTLASREQGASELMQEMRGRRNGQLRRVSPIDGIERLYGFRALDGFPLFAVTARGADEIVAASRSRGELWLAMGALVTLVITVLTANVLRRARQQAELLQALSLSRQKAELAQELKSRFLLDVADGMRGPMLSILERAEHLRDTHPEPHARAQARLIHDSAQQMCDRFSTLFDPCGPTALDADTLSGATLDQSGGGGHVDTAFDTAQATFVQFDSDQGAGPRSATRPCAAVAASAATGAAQSTSSALKSFTLVKVGPVTTRSPSASK